MEDPTFSKLNLACGRRIYPGKGWTNLDRNDDLDERVVACNIWDLDWPVEPNSITYVLASHILEHVPHNLPPHEGEFWYHFFPYLLSRLKDKAIIEVWGPDPEKQTTLQYVGHTRLVGPYSFSEYTLSFNNFSSLENRESRRNYDLQLIQMERRRSIHIGPVNDYHFIKYLGEGWRERLSNVLGQKDEIRMVFRVTKEDGV